jgi:hypothetical protein
MIRTMTKVWALAALVPFLAACGEDRETRGDAPSPEITDAGERSEVADTGKAPPVALTVATCAARGDVAVPGTYTVPVSPELEPYSSFAVDRVTFCADDSGEVGLDYDLPELLVGKSLKVSFRGPFDSVAGVYRLTGRDGDADCTPVSEGFRCDERLAPFDIDGAAVDRKLADLPADEAAARRDVATHFGQDPIGVLTFTPASR